MDDDFEEILGSYCFGSIMGAVIGFCIIVYVFAWIIVIGLVALAIYLIVKLIRYLIKLFFSKS